MDDADKVKALKERMWKKQYYLMFRTLVDPERIPEVLLEHYEWMIGMEKDGHVFASGPVFDRGGEQGVGLTVFRADSWEQAEELASADPFVTSGAVDFEIKRWQVNEGRISVSVDFSDQTFNAE